MTIGAACIDAGGCWLASDSRQCLGDNLIAHDSEAKIGVIPGRFGFVFAGDAEAHEFMTHTLSDLPEGSYTKREITLHMRKAAAAWDWLGNRDGKEAGQATYPFSVILTDGHGLWRIDQSLYCTKQPRWSVVGSGLEIGMGAAWVLERLGATPERLVDWVVKAAIHNVTSCGGVPAREFFPAAKFRIT